MIKRAKRLIVQRWFWGLVLSIVVIFGVVIIWRWTISRADFVAEVFGIVVGTALTIFFIDWLQEKRQQEQLMFKRRLLLGRIRQVLHEWFFFLDIEHKKECRCLETINPSNVDGDRVRRFMNTHKETFLFSIGFENAGNGMSVRVRQLLENVLVQHAVVLQNDPQLEQYILMWLNGYEQEVNYYRGSGIDEISKATIGLLEHPVT